MVESSAPGSIKQRLAEAARGRLVERQPWDFSSHNVCSNDVRSLSVVRSCPVVGDGDEFPQCWGSFHPPFCWSFRGEPQILDPGVVQTLVQGVPRAVMNPISNFDFERYAKVHATGNSHYGPGGVIPPQSIFDFGDPLLVTVAC